ncbi:polymorphic toxin-type HINT domain-containing protein [Streptomyces sp. NBC_00424]|uniref:polymorphic toxin-type HINT domain-containing protein n=1 Tax=Streptomyces sp. NBC_00424 TaxID=2903648 RepID=UPI00225B6705|nr:polymorphic toxin-type HINT domain-containing protein [Streptomyces sp. NBC_00424]MCX5078984.1 polymorphic toxin-type HINT domain-containing protein [Streptomyces sp. NBC_00424]
MAYWKAGGPATQAAAGAALTGSDADIRAFLDKGRAIAENLDDREAALQVVAEAGSAVRKAAEQALLGTPEQLDTFLKEGWKQPLEQDQRVEVARLGEAGGKAVKAEADKAMNGNIAAVRAFLSEGQYKKRDSDARVRVAQIETAGGPKVRAAASAALNGSIEDVREFITFGQHVARAQDQEHASVTELAQQAKDAGDAADRESKAAKEASDRAIALALLAKKETERARDEAAAAKKDAARAAEAARRAAESTRRAAQAAQAAISAARAANVAAQVAAAAASAAARAASGAADAAAKALTHAAAGQRDEVLAARARQAADAADAAATAAERAAISGDAAAVSARAAASSTANSVAAAAAAEEAGRYNEEAGGSAAEAREAAATARRHAGEATRAADKAAAHASDAARHARQARDAARSSATHARNAADAAMKAGQHAAGSKEAAAESKAHADAALARANEALAAVKKAQEIHEQARKAEADELVARKATGINQAKDLKAAYDKTLAEEKKAGTDAHKLQAEFARLAQDAAQPSADPTQIAVAGRKMALAALQTRGPWSRAAAESALAAPDAVVVDYARNGWRTSEQQDERDQVRRLADESPYAAVNKAAQTALGGTADQVHTFLVDGQHTAAASDYRVEVARIGNEGGPAVKKASDAALNGTGYQPLLDFLTTVQYTARDSDDRVTVARLAETAGPEVKAYADIAMEGPVASLHTFVETGQYKAARRDQTNAGHIAQIQNIIAGSAQTAALAQQGAAEALKTAATAQNAANEASEYVLLAQAYAKDAAGYASQAEASANQAEASAKKAAEHASRARNAQQQAQASASNATASAAWAESSASIARGYAAQAYAAAEAARQSAINAGADANAAAATYRNHLDKYLAEQARANEETWWKSAYGKYQDLKEKFTAGIDYATDYFEQASREALTWYLTLTPLEKLRLKSEMLHIGADLLGGIPFFGEIFDIGNCINYAVEGLAFGDSSKYTDAAWSCGAAIPFLGWGAYLVKGKKWYSKAESLWGSLKGFKKKIDDVVKCMAKDSFPAGTLVLMADGSKLPIERVKVGDLVKAADPVTGVTGSRRVLDTIYTPDDRDFTTISLQKGSGAGQLTATDHHPFWNKATGGWTDAGQLAVGDTLQSADGDSVKIAGVARWKKIQPAYNLTVAELHTYHVLAGEISVLVHNCNRWSSQKNLDEHYVSHGAEMGFDSQREYQEAAMDLLCDCDGGRPGVMRKFGKDHEGRLVLRYFDPVTKEYGMKGQGGIITYYKLDGGLATFRAMPGEKWKPGDPSW